MIQPIVTAELLIVWKDGQRTWSNYSHTKREFRKEYAEYIKKNNINETLLRVKRVQKEKVIENPQETLTNCVPDFHEDCSNYRDEGNAKYCSKKCEFYEKQCNGCSKMFVSEKILEGKSQQKIGKKRRQ
jgi:hypothetical protein